MLARPAWRWRAEGSGVSGSRVHFSRCGHGNTQPERATGAQVYGRKNLRILYDAISTLADTVGSALAEVGRPLSMCIAP